MSTREQSDMLLKIFSKERETKTHSRSIEAKQRKQTGKKKKDTCGDG